MGFVERKLTIPSMGLLNPEFSSPEFTIREMTVADYKNLSAPGNWTDKLIGLVKSCLVSPSNVKIEEMLFADITYIVMCIRAISLSAEEAYTVGVLCPNINCQQNFDYTLNVPSDLDVKYLKEGSKEPFITKLDNGDEIGWVMPRVHHVLKFAHKSKNDKDAIFELAIGSRIVELNNKPVSSMDVDMYFNGLSHKIFSKLEVDMINNDFGVDIEFSAKCPFCGEAVKTMVRLDPSFFRVNARR